MTSIMKKTAIACLTALTLTAAAIMCAPASAMADELTAGQPAPSVKTIAFRTVSNPPAPKVDACLASGAGSIAVHASYVSSAQGYQFQISRDKKFKKGVKSKKVKAYGATFKGLKKGKKYYVRARAYQTSTNLCTKWSKKKSTKSGIAYGKSKIAGVWRVVSTNNDSVNNQIVVGGAYGKYYTVTFSKKGKITMKKLDDSSASITSWVATGKNKGYGYSNYQKVSTISISQGTMTLKEKASGLQMLLKRA